MRDEERVFGWDIESPPVEHVRPPRRSLLFMPGDDRHKIEKAAGLDVDSIILDLEDGVAFNRKAEARDVIITALQQVAFGPRECLIRINPVSSPFCRPDLDATVTVRPQGYVIPKVEEPEDLLSVSHFLDDMERQHGWPVGGMRLLALIETARGVMNLREIAGATARLDALMFGAEDLAGDMGATRTRAGWEVFYARSAVVTAAAAYDLQAIDTVFVALTVEDDDPLAAECEFARAMGYQGKMAIHPRQVPIINQAFSPTAADIAQAQELVDEYTQAQTSGSGVFVLNGKMVDRPMVRAAERVLALARAAGAADRRAD